MIRSRVKIKAIVLLLVALHVKAAPNRIQDVPENISNVNVTSSDNNTSQSGDSSPTKIVKLSILNSTESDGTFKSTNPQYDLISAIKSSANLMPGDNYGIMFNAPSSIKEPIKTGRKIVKNIKRIGTDGSPSRNRNSRVTVIKNLDQQIPVTVQIINKTNGDNLQTHHKWSIKSDNMTLNNTIIIGANSISIKTNHSYTKEEEEDKINRDRYLENIKQDEMLNEKLLQNKIQSIKYNAALALSDNTPDPPKNRRGQVKFVVTDHDNGQHKKENEEDSNNYPDLAKFNKRVEEIQSGRFADQIPNSPPKRAKLTPYMRNLMARISEEKALIKLIEEKEEKEKSDKETLISDDENKEEANISLRSQIIQPNINANEDVLQIKTKESSITNDYDGPIDYTKYITPAKRPLIKRPAIIKVNKNTNANDEQKNISTTTEAFNKFEMQNESRPELTTAKKNSFSYINGDDLDDKDLVKKNETLRSNNTQQTTADKIRFTYINGEDLDDKDSSYKNQESKRPSTQYSTAEKNRFTYINGGELDYLKKGTTKTTVQDPTANRNKFIDTEDFNDESERNKTAESIDFFSKIKDDYYIKKEEKDNYESKYQSTIEKLEKINKNKMTTSDPKIIDINENSEDDEDSYEKVVEKEIKTISSLIDARKKYIEKEILESNDKNVKKNITEEIETLEKISALQVHSEGIDQTEANANDKNYLKTSIIEPNKEKIDRLKKDEEEKIKASYSNEEYSKRKHAHSVNKELYTISTLINSRKEQIKNEISDSKNVSKNITDEIKMLDSITPLHVYLNNTREKSGRNDLKTSQTSYRRTNTETDDEENVSRANQSNKNEARSRGQVRYIPSKFETISPFISDTHVNKLYRDHGINSDSKSNAEITRERGILKYEISTKEPNIDIKKDEVSAVMANKNRVSSPPLDTNILHSRRPSNHMEQTTSSQISASTNVASLTKEKGTQKIITNDNNHLAQFGNKRVSSNESADIKNESELVKDDEIGKESIKTSLEINQGQTKKDDMLDVKLVEGQNTKASAVGILTNKNIAEGNDAKSPIIESSSKKSKETLQVKFVNRLNVLNATNDHNNRKINEPELKSNEARIENAVNAKVISKSDVESDSPTTFNLNIYPMEKSATPILGESVTKLQDVTKIMATDQTNRDGQDISTAVESRGNDQGLDISHQALKSRGGKDYMEMAENFRGFTSFGPKNGFGKGKAFEKSDAVSSDLGDHVEFSKHIPDQDTIVSPKELNHHHYTNHRGDQHHYHVHPDEINDHDDDDNEHDHHNHRGGNRDRNHHGGGDRNHHGGGDRNHHNHHDGDRDHHNHHDRDRDHHNHHDGDHDHHNNHHRRPSVNDDEDDDIKYILAEKQPYHYDTDKVSYDKNGNVHYGVIHGDDDDKCHMHRGEKDKIGTFAPDEDPNRRKHHHNLFQQNLPLIPEANSPQIHLPELNALQIQLPGLNLIDGSDDRDGPNDDLEDVINRFPNKQHSHHLFDNDGLRKITSLKKDEFGQDSKRQYSNNRKQINEEGDNNNSANKNTNQKRGSVKYDWNAMRSDWTQEDDADFPAEFGYNYETPTGISAYQKGVLKKIDDKRVFVVRGSYQYTSPDGTPITVHYTADETGFHPHIVAPNIGNFA